jgi:glycosyltransferase involved in cell wall biosynthesis
MLSGVCIEGGGAEQVIQDLARGFAARGHEVMVVFLEGTDEIVPDLEEAGIRCERLLPRTKLAAGPLADFNPSCVFGYRRLLSQFKPDVLHSHVPRPTLWVSLAQRTIRRRPAFVYTEHNVQEVYPSWAKWAYRTFIPVLDGVVCVSDAATQSFAARWPRAQGPTRVWNGIDPDRACPNSAPDEIRTRLGVDAEALVLCNVANVGYRKGQDVLVRAMAQLANDTPRLECWVAGALEHEPATVELVRGEIVEHELEDVVHLLGRRRDVADLLHAADVFVLSSRQEGFPITILEAMAAGKPIVATNVGGCAEAVVHGETGLIVPPENPEALAEALASLLADPELAGRMGAAGRERVQQEFTVDRMVEQHLALYEQALAKRRACPALRSRRLRQRVTPVAASLTSAATEALCRSVQ